MTIDNAPANEAVRPVPITRKSMISGPRPNSRVTSRQIGKYPRNGTF
jgi:hypothetical protein